MREKANTIRLPIKDDGIGLILSTVYTKCTMVYCICKSFLAMGSFILDNALGKGTPIEVVVPLT